MNETDLYATPKLRRTVVGVLAVVILLFSCLGFADKLVQFFKVAAGDADGIFALTPIVNYLSASFGFLLLILWAASKGAFHDLEQPKRWMLENEERLSATEQYDSRTICEARKR